MDRILIRNFFYILDFVESNKVLGSKEPQMPEDGHDFNGKNTASGFFSVVEKRHQTNTIDRLRKHSVHLDCLYIFNLRQYSPSPCSEPSS